MKKKTIVTMESGKSYETDKYKCISTLISRKRYNEIFIGDYESEINTNVLLTVAEIKNNNSISFENKKNETSTDEENDNYESESDSDDSDSNSDIINNKNKFVDKVNNNKLNNDKVEHSIFEKYINEKTIINGNISLENKEKVIQIFNNGYDNDGNIVTINDIKYVERLLPNYFIDIIKEKLNNKKVNDRFKYMKFLRNIDDVKIDCKMDNNGNINAYRFNNNSNSLDLEIAYNKYKEIIEEEKIKTNEEQCIKEKISKRKIITEEEYFNPVDTNKIHIGRIMNIKEERKNMNNIATFYLSKKNQFPINLVQMLPIIHYLHMIAYDQINLSNYKNDPDIIRYLEVVKNCTEILEAYERFPIKIGNAIFILSLILLIIKYLFKFNIFFY